jgi:hypothetical protein
VNGEELIGARFAAVGLGTTTGASALITDVAVMYLDRASIIGGPFAYRVQVDVPTDEIPSDSRESGRLALPWGEAAAQVLLALSDRVVLVHDEDRLNVLRSQWPEWEPGVVVFARDLAERAWPELDAHDLYSLGRVGLIRWPRFGNAATVEAQALALVVSTLVRGPDRAAHTDGGFR